jgi:hypothetical protein
MRNEGMKVKQQQTQNKARFSIGTKQITVILIMLFAFTACENPIMIKLLEPLVMPEKGEEDDEKPVELKWWYTYESPGDVVDNDNTYVTTARINKKQETSDKTGCEVQVGGTANPIGYVWATAVGCTYPATAGKTYKITWTWKAYSKPYSNVTFRYLWYKDYQERDEFRLGTDLYKLTIPVEKETRSYYFTIPSNAPPGNTNFDFQIGADTGSFTISDFKIVEVKAGNERLKFKIGENKGTSPSGAYFHNYQKLYPISLPEIGGNIKAGDIYTFTYTFKSNLPIGDLRVFLADNTEEAGPDYWKELSDERKTISSDIRANEEVIGTITLIAAGTASSTKAEANYLGFSIELGDVNSEPTLTFTRFGFHKN